MFKRIIWSFDSTMSTGYFEYMFQMRAPVFLVGSEDRPAKFDLGSIHSNYRFCLTVRQVM